MKKTQLKVHYATLDSLQDCMDIDTDLAIEKLKSKIERNEIILSYQGELLVGYLRMEYIWLKCPFISFVHVHPSERGKGIGMLLLHFLSQMLQENGYNIVYSSTIVTAIKAQDWHRKMGFNECGFWEGVNGNGIGELIFKKEIVRLCH